MTRKQAESLDLSDGRLVESDRARWLERLHTSAKAVASELEVEAVLDTIVAQVSEYGPWSSCCILRVDFEADVMEVVAQHNLGDEFHRGYRLPATGSVTTEAALTRQPIVIQDARTTENPRAREHAARVGYRSLLVVPLPIDQDIVLNVYASTPNSFGPLEISYVSALASHAAIALRNAQLYSRIREQNDRLHRLVQTHTRLVQMVLDGSSLAVVARTLSEALHRPVAVFDRLGKLLTASPDSGYWAALEVPTAGGPAAPAAAGTYTIPLIVGDEALGMLAVAAAEADLGETDRIAVAQGALVAAIEMMKQKIAVEAELRLRSDFLNDLLAGHPAATYDRAAFLGCDPNSAYDVLVVDLDGVSSGRPVEALREAARLRTAAAMLERWLTRLQPRAMAVVHGDDVVVLIPPSADEHAGAGATAGHEVERIAREVQSELSRQFRDATVSIGIGRKAASLRDVQTSYSEAYRALSAARGLGRVGQVVTIDSLGIYAMLFHDESQKEMRAFVDRTLGQLERHDRERGSAYVATLAAYLKANCNLRAAARDLHVHVNTLMHRLKRIQQVGQIDMNDADSRLQVHVALKLRELETELEARQ